MRLIWPTITITTAAVTGVVNIEFCEAKAAAFIQSGQRMRFSRVSSTSSSITSLTRSYRSNRFKKVSLSVSTASDVIDPLPSLGEHMPVLGDDGIYELNSQEEHAALMELASDKLVILKVYAPWCRACKGLAPSFQKFVNDPKYNDNLPVIWASLSIQHTKAFVKNLGVIALPTVQFYVGGKLVESFGCGPSKVPMLKRKLATLINDHVDPVTRELKQSSIEEAANLAELAAVRAKEEAQSKLDKRNLDSENDDETSLLSPEERRIFMNIPYLKELSLADFDHLLEKARMPTFEPGHIIVRQDRPGRLFYIIKSGEVEISSQTGSEDPMVSSGYLGTIINRLGAGDHFGERSLITGEPRAATVRATEETICWAFDIDDFPESSILSGRSKGLAKTSIYIANINDKYGIDMGGQLQAITRQLRESSSANQVRGSINNPFYIKGVDDDLSVSSDSEDDAYALAQVEKDAASKREEEKYNQLQMPSVTDNSAIFTLLTRFQMILNVKTCFEYMTNSNAKWGTPGIRKRRNLLVKRLSPSQHAEFSSTFKLIDSNGDGTIELIELKRVLDTVSTNQSDEDFLANFMANGNRIIGSVPFITYEDFMGIMAEAEFYHLFRNIFATLDEDNTGYVKAYELDRVLCGVRDLISDDHKSIIDVEDMDMSIDYEHFARMLLGTA